MSTDRFPDRVRLWGADGTCAVGAHSTWRAGATACKRLPVTPDQPQPADAPITCRNCIRELNR